MDHAVESFSDTSQFPKLNGANYHEWADNMKAVLQAKSLWGVVSGRERCPLRPPNFPKLAAVESTPTTSATSPDKVKVKDAEILAIFQSKEYRCWTLAVDRYHEWWNRNDAAIGLIWNAIGCLQRESVIYMDSSEMQWTHFRKTYICQQRGIKCCSLYQQLYSRKWDETSPLSDHIGFYVNLRRQNIEAGRRADDVVIIGALLLSLPCTPTWEAVKQDLFYRGGKITLESVVVKLEAML